MEKIATLITKNNNFLLCCHIRPDGDAIGSSLALYLALKKLNKNVDIMCDDEIPSTFSYLKGVENFNKKTLESYDCFISLDCSDLARIGNFSKYFSKNTNSINIDHHRTNDSFAKNNLIKSDFASTCEIVFDIIEKMNVDFDKDMATALYTGISTDTGNFAHSNTTSETLRKASVLAKFDIDINKLVFILYKNMSKEKLIVLGKTLDSAKFYCNDKVCILTIRKEFFEGLNFNESISSGIVDYAINLETTKIGICILEAKPNTFKISFRSKEPFDVAELSSLYGGGGHKLASGCVICGFYEDVLDKILKGIDDLFSL